MIKNVRVVEYKTLICLRESNDLCTLISAHENEGKGVDSLFNDISTIVSYLLT